MSDKKTHWPFDGFYLKLVEAQREYEQEQHIDPASLTEEERQQKLQEILDCIKASRKKKKEADEQLDPIVPEEEPETAGATPQPAKQYITDLVGEDYKNWHGIVVLDAGTNSGKTYFILKTLLPWAYERRKTPVAQHMALRVLTLPLYADLALEDVDRICDVILG